MEIVDSRHSLLTNLEVMQYLQQIKSSKKKFGMRSLATIIYEILQHLEESPCKTQTRETIVAYLQDLSQYKLQPKELLMMVNDPPTSALHMQLLVDDNNQSLTDNDVESILALTRKHFHRNNPTEPAAS